MQSEVGTRRAQFGVTRSGPKGLLFLAFGFVPGDCAGRTWSIFRAKILPWRILLCITSVLALRCLCVFRVDR